MRHKAQGHLAPHFQPALDLDIDVEKPAVLAPGKREAQREAFGIQPAHRPADIRRGDAFDEIGARAGVEIVAQFLDRAQRQAGPRDQTDMAHIGEVFQHQLAGFLGGGDDAPGAPFADMARRKADISQILQCIAQEFEFGIRGRAVNMDHHRAAAFRPVACHLRRAVQRGMAQHDEAQAALLGTHAQFPLDMRPRISS